MKVKFGPAARKEMLRAAIRYDQERPGLGGRFLDDVAQAIRSIRRYPMASPPLSSRHRRHVMRSFPYQLIYEVRAEDEIIIVAVAHFKRRPGYWRRRSG